MTETAYYYPAPYWDYRDSGWVKSLLLFFDATCSWSGYAPPNRPHHM